MGRPDCWRSPPGHARRRVAVDDQAGDLLLAAATGQVGLAAVDGEALVFDDATLLSTGTAGLQVALLHSHLLDAHAIGDAVAWIDGVEPAQPVEANIVFMALELEKARAFADLCGVHRPLLFPLGDVGLIRLVGSWDSQMEDVDRVVADLLTVLPQG